MTIDFYYNPKSPPCRAVLMLAEVLKLKLNLKLIDTGSKENFKPDFLKINPQHCIPTIVDDGFVLWESRAILTYLASKYGDGSLYPSDLQKKAVVDQRLFFDIGTLDKGIGDYIYPQIFDKQPADEAKLKKIEKALEILDTILKDNEWVAGSTVTVADISILSSFSLIQAMDIDTVKYPNIKAWFQRAKTTVPGFSLCEETIETTREYLKKFISVKS